MVCKDCGEREVSIKKWELCSKCYMKKWKSGELSTTGDTRVRGQIPKDPEDLRTIRVKELNFLRNYFDHGAWLYEPAVFKLKEENYTPDFYDQIRGVFIEVVGSRQAYHQRKKAYQELINLFPGIAFEIRTPDGKLFNEETPNCKEAGAWPEYGTTAK